MAVYTKVSESEAQAIATAHGLGQVIAVEPVAAGSVNTNYFLRCDTGRYFLRVYEEQGVEGVRYEWALLGHLGRAGAPVPDRVSGTEPGQCRVAGKPTAVFRVIGGGESCQKAVSITRAFEVGVALGRCHAAGNDFPLRQVSRFNTSWLKEQLRDIEARQRPELMETTGLLVAGLQEAERARGVKLGVIHGDLFRDNVRWEGDRIVGLLDWESASDGVLAFDLMVTVLAWCFDDTLEWPLARAMVDGYQTQRRLSADEAATLREWGIAAATRFSITRILSYHLREDAIGDRIKKDYRRFVQRLQLLRSLSADEVAARLVG